MQIKTFAMFFVCHVVGGCRSGLVPAHADPGEGHPFGSGGERPSGSSPDRIWEDCCVCYTCHPAHPDLQTGEEQTGITFCSPSVNHPIL